MKKVIYTLSFLTVFSVASRAQTAAPAQQELKKETLSPDGAKKAPAPSQAQPATPVTKEEQPATPKTRMAINEKGVPASKATDAKAKKEEKPASSPGQPSTTEKH